jgi:hypothetical protein
MKDEIPVLHCKLKKYERKSKQKSKEGKEQVNRRYMIPVKKDQIEGTKFQEVEDIVILSKEDFKHELQKSKVMSISHEKLKQSLKSKEQKIRDLNERINQENINENKIEDLKDNLNKKFKLKLDNIIYEYETDIKALNDELENLNEIKSEYNNLNNDNKAINRELKRLSDLRTLEKESFKIKIHELELNMEEYNKLKKSHELLWEVVEQKDKKIKDLEKRSIMDNLFHKIRK